MQSTGVNGSGGGTGGGNTDATRSEDVISKLKEDGDFDRLRLKIIRKFKENDELRENIISVVKQSAVLNSLGAENMKPRQLSDAIHKEIGDKLMSQVSDGIWNIIRSTDGMKTEITETVQSVYSKIFNLRRDNNGGSSFHAIAHPIQYELEKNREINASAGEVNNTISDREPNEPPGFGSGDLHQSDMNILRDHHNEISAPPSSRKRKATKEIEEENKLPKDSSEQENRVSPGISSAPEHDRSCDVSDEDPDVPPGFG